MGQPNEVVTWQPAAPGIWRVTMASPPANALSVPLLDGLHAALDAAEGDEIAVRGAEGAMERSRVDRPAPRPGRRHRPADAWPRPAPAREPPGGSLRGSDG